MRGTAGQLIFSILPGAQEPGTGGTRDAESAKGGWQHPSTYALLRIWLHLKIANFLTERPDMWDASRVQITRGVSYIRVFRWAFGDASDETWI